MPLPRFQRFRPRGTGPAKLDELGQLERAAGDFADGLTGPGGVLARGLTFREHFRGQVVTVRDFTVPDEWATAPLEAGWRNALDGVLGVNQPLAWKKDPLGRVMLRGRFEWTAYATSSPATSQPVALFPEGWAPPARELVEVYGVDAAGTRMITVLEAMPTSSVPPYGALRWAGGGYRGMSASGQILWDAADRRAPPWAEESRPVVSLGQDFPGEPEAVQVLNALRSDGVHQGPLQCEWERTSAGQFPAIRLRRVEGLAPGQTYTLTLAVLAA